MPFNVAYHARSMSAMIYSYARACGPSYDVWLSAFAMVKAKLQKTFPRESNLGFKPRPVGRVTV